MSCKIVHALLNQLFFLNLGMRNKINYYRLMIILFVFTAFSPAQRKVDFNRLDYYQGKVYLGRESLPYTGFTYAFFGDVDQKKFDGYIRNGVMDGKWTFYHTNGLVKEKGHYRNADPKFLFSNVDEHTIPPLKNRNGTWRQFYQDGSKYTYGRFITGERWGMHTFFGFNDGLMVRSYYKNNLKNGYEYTFLNSRKIHTGLYRDGIQLWEPLETYNEGKVVLENPFNMPLYAPVMGERNLQETSFFGHSSRNEPTLAKMEITLDPGSVTVKEQLTTGESILKPTMEKNPVIVMDPETRPVEELYPKQEKPKSISAPSPPIEKTIVKPSKKSVQSGYIPFRIMFRAARKAGISTFSWQGKLYNTKLRTG